MTVPPEIPAVFVVAVRQLVAAVEKAGRTPARVECRFGPDTVHRCDPEVLRRFWSMQRLWNFPVVFPEQPGPVSGMLEVRVVSDADPAGVAAHYVAMVDVTLLHCSPAMRS